jgi:hypothetical protein
MRLKRWMKLGLFGGILLRADWNRPFWPLAICLILILLFAGLPVICVVISMAVANVLGCTLNEGDVHPCPFLGVDVGGLLYDLFVSGWFGLLTIPAGVILLLVWLAAAIVFAVKYMRARNQSGSV